jgi:hypothetical protein
MFFFIYSLKDQERLAANYKNRAELLEDDNKNLRGRIAGLEEELKQKNKQINVNYSFYDFKLFYIFIFKKKQKNKIGVTEPIRHC